MRLDIKAFRLIKPANAVDHYEAGNPLSPDRSSERTCKARELNIIKLLKTNGIMTNKQLAKKLNLARTTTSTITKNMVINNQIKKGKSIACSSTKHATTFYIES